MKKIINECFRNRSLFQESLAPILNFASVRDAISNAVQKFISVVCTSLNATECSTRNGIDDNWLQFLGALVADAETTSEEMERLQTELPSLITTLSEMKSIVREKIDSVLCDKTYLSKHLYSVYGFHFRIRSKLIFSSRRDEVSPQNNSTVVVMDVDQIEHSLESVEMATKKRYDISTSNEISDSNYFFLGFQVTKIEKIVESDRS